MQATLLGLSIAMILALVAALVGPHFVDWGQYRAQFEAEASQLIGMPVRVAGAIDARLLPTPSVVLNNVAVGAVREEPRLRVRELSIELGLGPLVRGQWHASELRLRAPELHLALAGDGAGDWPALSAAFAADQFSSERCLVEDGRIVVEDSTSGGRFALDHLSFAGEFRSLLGPVKGEGSFAANGTSYRYSLGAGRFVENEGRLHLELHSPGWTWHAATDGVIRFMPGAPEFDGALTLSQPAGVVDASGRGRALVPWRANAHVKATIANALFDKADFQYGPDEQPVRLSGAANIRFGKSPRYDAVISGRQVNIDPYLSLPQSEWRSPPAAARELGGLLSGALDLPIPGRVGMSIDVVTLAGGPLHQVHADATSDANGWNIESLELRAPGATQARVTGRIDVADQAMSFRGSASLESADPDALLGWLEARPVGGPQHEIRQLHASGELALGPDRIAVDRFRVAVDGKEVEGRIAYFLPLYRRPARLEAELKAAELNLDEFIRIVPTTVARSGPAFPAELMLSADIGQAIIGNIPATDLAVQLSYDASGLVIDRLSVGNVGGASLRGQGRLQSLAGSPEGSLVLDLKAAGPEGLAALTAKLVPGAADWVRPTLTKLSPVEARATLTLGRGSGAGSALAKLLVEGTAGPLRLRATSETTGSLFDFEALELGLKGTIAAEDGSQLIAILALDHTVNVEKGPGTIGVLARGRLGGDLGIEGEFAAPGLTARAKGTARLLDPAEPSASFDVSVTAADAMPAWGYGPKEHRLPLTLKGRLSMSPGKVNLGGIVGSVEGSPVRGRLGISLADRPKLDGHLEAEEIFVPGLLAAAIGNQTVEAGLHSTEPFQRGMFDKWVGRVEFDAEHAIIAPGLAARGVRGLLRLEKDQIAFENVEGELAGGRLRGELAFRREGAQLATHAGIALTNVDAAAIIPGFAIPPVSGRLTLQTEVDGAGTSPATLLASFKGAGTVSLDAGRLAGLDPKAFPTVIRAADHGLIIDAAKVAELVQSSIAGQLTVPRMDAALTIVAGRARVSNVIAHGEGADVTITGTLDVPARSIDASLIVSGPADGGAPGSGNPELFIALRGPAMGPQRQLDVSALVTWLTLRSLDRQTRRLEAVDPIILPGPSKSGSRPETAAPARRDQPSGGARPEASATSVDPAPALPPPLQIRPPPGGNRPASQRPREATGGAVRPGARDKPSQAPPPNRAILDRLFGPQR